MTHAAFDIRSFFELPLVDMGSIDPDMRGVYIPEQEIGKPKIGVTSQFLSEAETYHQKYSANAYYQHLFENALQRVSPLAPGAGILDIGSGSGNSVLACLDLLPDCKIVASDISEHLLAILLRYIRSNIEYRDRVVAICMDATNGAFYKPGSFNLVTGAAILHHLIDPATAVTAAGKALMPGGSAIFFEPFENGNAILRLAYREVIRCNEEKPVIDQIPPRAVVLLKALMRDFEVRTGTDKTSDIFKQIDDKWLFTKTYLQKCAERASFSDVHFYPIHAVDAPFRRQTEVNLRLGAGLLPESFPSWAWAIMDFYDNHFSKELKQDLLLEGCIVLTR